MRSKSKKQKQQYHSDQEPEQQQEKVQGKAQLKISQCRDYIAMRCNQISINQKIQKKKKQPKIQKHSLQVHRHLQPDQIVGDDQQENNVGRDEDRISLLTNYTKQPYQKFLATIKQNVLNEKPYTDIPQNLLQTLASNQFNVCIYGFGSKVGYLRYIMENYLNDHQVWQVNGYKTTINDKKIYNNFGVFLKTIGVANKLQKIVKFDQIRQYNKYLQKYALTNKKQIVVIFHCIDSAHLLNQDSQQNLSMLFSLPGIKLVCSMDSIKTVSIWHPRVRTRYNFRFFQINTSKPYIQQQMFRPNTTDIRQQSDQAIMNIYKSLNSNQKRILKLFAKKQLQNNNKDQPQYYTLQTLLDQCIENVILSNDTQLRENMLQLIDHKVIVPIQKIYQQRAKKYYTIKCNKGILQTIFKDKIQDQF